MKNVVQKIIREHFNTCMYICVYITCDEKSPGNFRIKVSRKLLLSLINILFLRMLNRLWDTFASHRRIRKSFLKGQQDKIGTVGFWYFISPNPDG
jgi:hypothetical protein